MRPAGRAWMRRRKEDQKGGTFEIAGEEFLSLLGLFGSKPLSVLGKVANVGKSC